MTDAAFRKRVLTYWRRHGRHDLPWRHTTNPYRILVSEVMLQQTQVSRVAEKYHEFLRAFPAFRMLAVAPTSRVLKVWQGLGYNRRALMLQRCARAVVGAYHGKLPQDKELLRALPGIGPYTAGAVMAFAFDCPVAMIETNIRRVYLHHFFANRRKVDDAEILALVTRDVGRVDSPREWYSALMDYGTYLATTVPNPNRRSRHYICQAPFKGSFRQIRGKILRYVSANGPVEYAKLASLMNDVRTPVALKALEREGFIHIANMLVHLVA